ncbi:MAG: hypothetical protein ACRERU_10145 [Methylococcales bacterium]
MSLAQPSPLEAAVLAEFYELYKDRGFPAPSRVHVRRRENTGSGRYVDLDALDNTEFDDGYLDMAGRFIEMNGVPNGLMAVARVKDHRVQQIELSVYGDDAWDGEEGEWAITR